jgi:hypothetical protein
MGHLPPHWPSSRSPLSHRCQWARRPHGPTGQPPSLYVGPPVEIPSPPPCDEAHQQFHLCGALSRCPGFYRCCARASAAYMHATATALSPPALSHRLAQAAPYRAGAHATAATPLCHRDATDKPLAAKSSTGHLAASYGIAAEQAIV